MHAGARTHVDRRIVRAGRATDFSFFLAIGLPLSLLWLQLKGAVGKDSVERTQVIRLESAAAFLRLGICTAQSHAQTLH